MEYYDEFFSVPLQDVKRELRTSIWECEKRGLMQTAKWLAEMNHGLTEVDIDSKTALDEEYHKKFLTSPFDGITVDEYDLYHLAKTYFNVREYDRAAYFLSSCESPVPRFLYFYSLYLAKDKRRLDSLTDNSILNSNNQSREFHDLLTMLRSEYRHDRLDGYGLYLYGVVLKRLNLNSLAKEILVKATQLEPMLWCAYLELMPLIEDKEKLFALEISEHWMRQFFIAHAFIELYLNDEGIKAYEDLQASGFNRSVYITAQLALAHHNTRDVDRAIEIFQSLQEIDPYRLDNMDTYSNLLFVKEMKTEMAVLAHQVSDINKYRPETCCVIGNYYSIRGDHQNAIMYFQRALKLNPNYLAAWTLMGHEFMELKNTNAAIQSYRKAVEVNRRDYRAWYGLGQSYEIFKMHYYSLYYFKVAHTLRPYDSRMLVALGEAYEKLDKSENAIKCYWKACDVGDIEGVAMYKLANLHEKLGDYELAVRCYTLFCNDERSTADKQSLYHGYMTLANYYVSKEQFDKAAHYAYKCLESNDVRRKAEAKALLKTIENHRKEGSGQAASSSGANVVTPGSADSSSSDDMDLDLSDYKFFSGADYDASDPVITETLQTAQGNDLTPRWRYYRQPRPVSSLSNSTPTGIAPLSSTDEIHGSTPHTTLATPGSSSFMNLIHGSDNEETLSDGDDPMPSTSADAEKNMGNLSESVVTIDEDDEGPVNEEGNEVPNDEDDDEEPDDNEDMVSMEISTISID